MLDVIDEIEKRDLKFVDKLCKRLTLQELKSELNILFTGEDK